MPKPNPYSTLPPAVVADLAAQALLRRKISFRAHARRMIATLPSSPLVLGGEHIPRGGPVVITANHYQRPGFFIPWLAAAISAQVEGEVTWLMTGAWTFPNGPLASLREGAARWAFHRVGAAYGFHTMPPMPPRPQDAADRAAAVTRLLRFARAQKSTIIGLTPEGADSPDGRLSLPPEGSGRLMLALSSMGYCFHPAGVYEQAGRLAICFGMPYRLEVEEMNRAAADLRARQYVMARIAACLPDQLRGEFAGVGFASAGCDVESARM